MSTYVMPTGSIQLYIDKTKVASNTTFALFAFNGSGLPSSFWSGVNASGNNFFFSTPAGVVIPHDVVFFDKTNSGLGCCIRLPSVSVSQNTSFLLQWGDGTTVDTFTDAYKNLYGGSVDAVLASHFEGTFNDSTSYNLGTARYESTVLYYSLSGVYGWYPYTNNFSFFSGLFGRYLISPDDASAPDGVIYDDQDAYSFNGPYTIIANVYPHANGGYIVKKGEEYAVRMGPNDRSFDGTITVLMGHDTTAPNPPMLIKTAASPSIVAWTWNQIAVTYDGSNTVAGINIYSNASGTATSSPSLGTYSGAVNNAEHLSVGYYADGVPYTKTGRIDSVFLFNGCLTSGEITTFYNSFTPSGLSSVVISGVTTPVAPTILYPTISSQPSSASKNIGEYVTFSVTSPDSTSYQWRKNGINIEGAISSGYFIPYISESDAGTYTVVCTNAYGSTVSNEAVLTIIGTGDGSSQVYGGSKYYVSGHINTGYITGADVNVPVPIGGSGLPTHFWSNVYRVDGKDIVITDLNGVPFRREITEFDRANEKLTIWVKFPNISGTNPVPFLLQYGSTSLNYNNDYVFSDNYTQSLDHVIAAHWANDYTDSSIYKNEWYGWLDTNQANNWYSWYNTVYPSGFQAYPVFQGNSKFDYSLPMNVEGFTAPYYYMFTQPTDQLSFVTSSGDAPFTIRTWIKPKTGNDWTDDAIVSKGREARWGEYYFGLNENDQLTLQLYSPDTSDTNNYAYAWKGRKTDYITGGANTWQHFAVTYDGVKASNTGITFYINNSEVASTSDSGNYLTSMSYSGMTKGYGDLELGRRVRTNQTYGYVYSYATDLYFDNIFILNGILTSGQMLTQYNLESNFNNVSMIEFSDYNTFDIDIYVPPESTDAPVILVGPLSQTKYIGESVTFTTSVSGVLPFEYLWRLNGVTINGATSSSYTINPVTAWDAGTYTFGVHNAYGTAYANAVLTVVTSSGIVPDPTGVIPNPDPSGSITPSGSTDPNASGATIVGLPSGYVFINKSFAGLKAEDATNIYQFDIGSMFYDDIKEDRFLFGSLKQGKTNFYIYVSGVNSSSWDNIELSQNGADYYNGIVVTMEYNEIRPIYLRYTVEDTPLLGYGTLLIGVGEATYE
jgi:hypothetical protein